ncbi:MAG: hypothetical protein ACRD9Y_06110 [Blastocatellia bacterium]
MIPAKTLPEAYNAVDPAPALPPGDPRYVDCRDVRGNEDIVAHLFRTISYSDPTVRATSQLVAGHRGCGKSTELFRLKDLLEKEGFCVVYFSVVGYLDLNDLIYTDLLLCIARRIVEDFSGESGEIHLEQEMEPALKAIEQWFSDIVFHQDEWKEITKELKIETSIGVGLPRSVPFIARLLAKLLGQIKTGDKIRLEVRQKLERQISQLLEQINDLLLIVNDAVKQHGKRGLVVIVDALDRIRWKDLGNERTSHDALYIDHGEQLRGLRCHTIYTVPISMVYSVKANYLKSIFPECGVLPMIRIHEPRVKGGGEAQAGIERLRTVLAHRIDLETLAEPEAVSYLCKACGGHLRELMTLMRYNIEYADEAQPQPITMVSAQRAMARAVTVFSRTIPEEHFIKLACVHLTNRILNDADHQLMLFNLSVLEYANGEEPWYDVHPAVQRLTSFRQALARVSEDGCSKLIIKS